MAYPRRPSPKPASCNVLQDPAWSHSHTTRQDWHSESNQTSPPSEKSRQPAAFQGQLQLLTSMGQHSVPHHPRMERFTRNHCGGRLLISVQEPADCTPTVGALSQNQPHICVLPRMRLCILLYKTRKDVLIDNSSSKSYLDSIIITEWLDTRSPGTHVWLAIFNRNG